MKFCNGLPQGPAPYRTPPMECRQARPNHRRPAKPHPCQANAHKDKGLRDLPPLPWACAEYKALFNSDLRDAKEDSLE